jgi:hypothetical protein
MHFICFLTIMKQPVIIDAVVNAIKAILGL